MICASTVFFLKTLRDMPCKFADELYESSYLIFTDANSSTYNGYSISRFTNIIIVHDTHFMRDDMTLLKTTYN